MDTGTFSLIETAKRFHAIANLLNNQRDAMIVHAYADEVERMAIDQRSLCFAIGRLKQRDRSPAVREAFGRFRMDQVQTIYTLTTAAVGKGSRTGELIVTEV